MRVFLTLILFSGASVQASAEHPARQTVQLEAVSCALELNQAQYKTGTFPQVQACSNLKSPYYKSNKSLQTEIIYGDKNTFLYVINLQTPDGHWSSLTSYWPPNSPLTQFYFTERKFDQPKPPPRQDDMRYLIDCQYAVVTFMSQAFSMTKANSCEGKPLNVKILSQKMKDVKTILILPKQLDAYFAINLVDGKNGGLTLYSVETIQGLPFYVIASGETQTLQRANTPTKLPKR